MVHEAIWQQCYPLFLAPIIPVQFLIASFAKRRTTLFFREISATNLRSRQLRIWLAYDINKEDENFKHYMPGVGKNSLAWPGMCCEVSFLKEGKGILISLILFAV